MVIRLKGIPVLVGGDPYQALIHLDTLMDELESMRDEVFPILFSTISDELSEYISKSNIKLMELNYFEKINLYEKGTELKFACLIKDTYSNDTQFFLSIDIKERDNIRDLKRKLALSLLEFFATKGNRFFFGINSGKYEGSVGFLEKNKLNLGFHKLSYKIISIPVPSKKNISFLGTSDIETRLVVKPIKNKKFYDSRGNEVIPGNMVVIADWYLSVGIIVDVDSLSGCLVVQPENYHEKRLLDKKTNFISLDHIDINAIKATILMEKLSS